MIKITEINADLNEVIEREATADEILSQKNLGKIYEAQLIAETDKAAVKQSAQAKLAALGLTEEEVASILG